LDFCQQFCLQHVVYVRFSSLRRSSGERRPSSRTATISGPLQKLLREPQPPSAIYIPRLPQRAPLIPPTFAKMRLISKAIAIIALPSLAHAVSLADLTPRAVGLPPDCQKIYTAQIPGCDAQDFMTQQCSSSCIAALEGLAWPIKQACSGVTGRNIIVTFLANVGPGHVCDNAPQRWTGTPSSSMAASTSSPHRTTRGKSTVTKGIMTATSLPSTRSSRLMTDSSNPPSVQTRTSTARASTLPAQLNHHDHSGGGSPFDTLGNLGGAASLSISLSAMILSTAFALLANAR